MSLGDLLTTSHFGLGPPEYVNAPVRPGRTLPCLAWALLLVTSPTDGPMPGLTVQAVAPDPR